MGREIGLSDLEFFAGIKRLGWPAFGPAQDRLDERTGGVTAEVTDYL